VVFAPGVVEPDALPGFVPPTFEALDGPELGDSALPVGVPPPEARHGFDCELLLVPFFPAGPVPELSDDCPLFAEPDVAAPDEVDPEVVDWPGVPVVLELPLEPMVLPEELPVPLVPAELPLPLAPAAPPALAPPAPAPPAPPAPPPPPPPPPL
jgi:hypothetical protein